MHPKQLNVEDFSNKKNNIQKKTTSITHTHTHTHVSFFLLLTTFDIIKFLNSPIKAELILFFIKTYTVRMMIGKQVVIYGWMTTQIYEILQIHVHMYLRTQWAKSPKKQSVGVYFGDFAHWEMSKTCFYQTKIKIITNTYSRTQGDFC